MNIIQTKISMLEEMIADAESVVRELQMRLAIEEQVVITLNKYKANLNSSASESSVSSPANVAYPSAAARYEVANANGNLVEEGKLPAFIIQALRDAGIPLNITQITARIEKLGATTQASRGLYPVVNSALVRRSDLFVRVRAGFYDLVERQEKDADSPS